MNTKQWFEYTENITGIPCLDKNGIFFTYPNNHATYVLGDTQCHEYTGMFLTYDDSPKDRVDYLSLWYDQTENKEILGTINIVSFKAAIATLRAIGVSINSSPVLIAFGENSGYLLVTATDDKKSSDVSVDNTYMVEFKCKSNYSSVLKMFIDPIYQMIKGFKKEFTIHVSAVKSGKETYADNCLVLLKDSTKTRFGMYFTDTKYVDMY